MRTSLEHAIYAAFLSWYFQRQRHFSEQNRPVVRFGLNNRSHTKQARGSCDTRLRALMAAAASGFC